ncbi:MAG: PBP1A family penicillin-binding protein [Candidatus Faecisoma sp.]|nr:PBP1A family penicillin-binding protein [Acholeplasma sp.]MDY2892321.1 PBP1A family penicillin-binding protein [Candidatus Faecisoma sp.]
MKKLFKILLIIMTLGIIMYSGIYLIAWIYPKLNINNSKSYYFYDKDSNLISGTDEYSGIDAISPYLKNATLSIEDRHFYTHGGFDYLRIGKAMFNNIKSGKTTEGASTITQQYAKNLFLDFDKTWKRKITEAWLTVRLEVHYDKDKILEGYLNTINYGGVFGIANASEYYFGKDALDLNLAEASMLAGIPNWPSRYSPYIDYEASKERQLVVLNSMVRDNYITKEEADNAYNEELNFVTKSTRKELDSVRYFRDSVISELNKISSIPNSLLTTGGLKIYTTFDPKAQEAIESTINQYIKSDIQVASIIMEPNTGAVLGLTGGVDYSKSQFNRATSSNRSVGSTIKPFLYYAALENGFTPSTTFTSEPTTFVFAENQTYSPTNYNDKYANKEISLAAAIAYSDNIYAVKTHLFLGENTLVETLKRVGITANLDSIPSLALGSQAISLIDMTSAYSTLANEGYKVKPYFINKVEDINGNVLYEYEPVKEAILNKSLVYVLDELLANTANPNFIDYSYPTSYMMMNRITKKYGIKTGTTEVDHLIIGFNKDAVVSIWSGYDDNRKLLDVDSYNNKYMWSDIIEKYLKDKEEAWYDIPNNVVGVLVEPVSGKIATDKSKNKTIMYYIKGTEPSSDYNLDDVIPTIKQE